MINRCINKRPLPQSDWSLLPLQGRALIVLVIVALHGLALWGVLQVTEVRQALVDVAPVFVRWIAPAPAEAVPEPVTTQPVVRKVERPRAKPVAKAVAQPTSTPLPEPVLTGIPKEPEAAETDTASIASVSPAAAFPEADQPREITISEVRYLERPAPIYPRRSLRLGEEGQVLVRVLINRDGSAGETVVARSSGSERLDEAALAAVRRARFEPYRENGVAVAVWAQVPITFSLR